MAKKFNQYRQWFISLSAIAIIVVGTVVLVAIAQGYTYDFTTHKFTKSGLVLIDSEPSDASITLNSTVTRKRTPYRYANAAVGQLTVSLSKPEYRNWTTKTVVTPGEVSFLDYAILLPQTLHQDNLPQNQPYSSLIQSPNQDRTIGLSKTPLTLSTIASNGQTKIFYQPNAATNTVTDITNVVSSYGGDKVLAELILVDGAKKTVVIDSNSGKIDNLTDLFGQVFTGLTFNTRNASELYWQDNGDLKKIQLEDKTIPPFLVRNVQSYNVARDRLLVVRQSALANQVQISSYNLDGNDEKNILTLPIISGGYQLTFIHSRFAEYLTILNPTSGNLKLVKNPYNKENIQNNIQNLGDGVSALTTAPNNRFLVLNQGSHMRTLDLEYNQDLQYGSDLNELQSWNWYDDYHLIIKQNNQLRLIDYDGQNNQLLTPISDVSGYSIQQRDKSLLPLNSAGNIYRLYLTKK